MNEIPDGAMPIGEITIRYWLNEDGHPIVTVDRPGFDVIPALSQLGMVAFANDDVMHGDHGGDDE